MPRVLRSVSNLPRLQIISRQPSILDKSPRDFVRLFVHHAGESEVPKCFLEWGAVSLLAAAVAERCFLYFFKGSKLHPNLYTFLLADSGVGKGVTCDLVQSFLKDKMKKALVGAEESRTTAQGVMDRLAGRFKDPGSLLKFVYEGRNDLGKLALVETEEEALERDAAQHRLYLVFEELALSVGSGQRADDFIKFLTKAYGGKGFVDRTRTYGEVDIGEEICLNVLAGSTHRWLKDCVSLDAVLGGFFARCVVVDGDAEVRDKRRWRPVYPHDTDIVREHLQKRVDELIELSGEFKLTAEADEIGEKWYLERPAPDDPVLGPIFRRERAAVLKLSLLFALSEGNHHDFKIHSRHMARAQEAIRSLSPAIMRVVAHSSITRDTKGLLELREFIGANPGVSHPECAKFMASIGVGNDQFRNLLNIFRDSGELVVLTGIRKGVRCYTLADTPRSLSDVPIDEHDGDRESEDDFVIDADAEADAEREA